MTSTMILLLEVSVLLLAASPSFARPLTTTTTTSNEIAAATQTTSASSQQQELQHHSSAVTIAVAVVVPLIITMLIATIVYSLHRKLRSSNRRQDVPRSSTTGSSGASSAAMSAMQGVGGWVVRHFTHAVVDGSTSSSSGQGEQQQQQQQGSSDSAHSRRRRGRRNRNALQRSDSGRSVKTLPEYNTSLGDNEMVLYKTEVANMDDLESDAMLAATTPNAVEGEVRDVGVPVSSRRVTVVTQTEEGEEREEVDEEDLDSQDVLEAGQRASLTTIAASGLNALRRSIRRSVNQSSNDAIRVEVTDEGDNDDTSVTAQRDLAPHSPVPTDATPTYDSIYPSLTELSNVAPARTVEGARQRPGGVGAFRNLFRRQEGAVDRQNAGHRRFASTASVLHSITPADAVEDVTNNTLMLMPTRSSDLNAASRPSTSLSARRFLVPYPSMANGSSVSLLSGASAESARLGGIDESSASRPRAHHRNISAPMSIRRLQFEAPAAGFTDQQMAFLASVESLDKYGIPLHHRPSMDEGEGRYENASTSLSSRSPVLPSFEQLARQEEEAERQRQAMNNGTATQANRPAPTLTVGELHVRREQEEQQAVTTTETGNRLPISPSVASSSDGVKHASRTTATPSTQT